MFSTSLGRVARTTCALPASSSAISSRPLGALAAANHLLVRRTQRRNSSTSCPPDNSRGPGTSQTSTASSSSKTSEKKSTPRGKSKKLAQQQMNVPSVPSTSYLQETDVALSSFFSVHRPISITTSIPVASSETTFGAIFEPRKQSGASKYGDVIYTLGNAVKSLEGGAAQSSEETELREEIMRQSASNDGTVHHLDGPAPARQVSLNELLSQMRPFNAPPPPVSFDQSQQQSASKSGAAEALEAEAQQTQLQKPQKKVWKATLTVTESTDATGRKTFSATTSPAIRMPTRSEGAIEDPLYDEGITIRQPFLERMEIREQGWRKFIRDRSRNQGGAMHALSVKRQRKLKMKKHKYKKLMKRTRNLRRKLGQA
ncbi:uncharacterized protein LTHEOB_5828 [Neofusicoccum parvum]|uniref:Uncharacterized protein LTHEOB_5828 n=1 Tax=Neofusicoccum parvum TaxID=310453 RepID=A0ACB5SA01_9PEZI|nr:uncharacterized protein LTHEOB_5828 [Neofusicoccum parvum]